MERLNWFFGNERWKNCEEADDLLKCYVDKIRNETTRKIVLPFPVKGSGSYRYDIILATRRTSGGSSWIKPMEELQEIMGGYRPEIVKRTLDILMKRQKCKCGICIQNIVQRFIIVNMILNQILHQKLGLR